MLEAIRQQLPDYAKDLKLNLSALDNTPSLTAQQLYGTYLASAYATGVPAVVQCALAEVADKLSPEAVNAAKAAAAIMGMNNVYYRFVHLVSDEQYGKMPARLRMNVIGNPGIDKVDFELYSLAVSAINGCGMCMDSHEKIVAKHGISKEAVQDSVRVAAVVSAAARVYATEQALSA